MSHRSIAAVLFAIFMFGGTACGTNDAADDTPIGTLPTASCLAGDPDCYETGAEPDAGIDPAGSACPVGDADCYETGAEPGTGDGPSAGMCAPGVTDCVDADLGTNRCTPEAVGCDDTPGADEFPADAARAEAQGLLGVAEANLPESVRIARRGSETFGLTEDYSLGRATVELDDTDGSGFRVVAVSVELPDGPESFALLPE